LSPSCFDTERYDHPPISGKVMNYKKTLDYLYEQLPMFHRVGSAAYKANLDNTIAICKLLGNPENKFRSIHIAGTNGKGSTSHMIAAVFQAAGYKTGLYTSPHLKDFRERIRINGKMIPRKKVTGFVEKYKEDFERIRPSFFEWTVGLAFDHFANEKVDIAIIEVGLGGRLDSTNVITPLLSVITNISYDHMALLGNTLPEIAGEKAGIIKPGVPVIIGEKQKGIAPVFMKKAKKEKAPIAFASETFEARRPSSIVIKGKHCLQFDSYYSGSNKVYRKKVLCGLTGMYQLKNIITVLTVFQTLGRLNNITIPGTAILKGLRDVKELTGLRGRWDILSKSPLTIADTGHNEAGIKEVLKMIDRTPHKGLHFVLGMVNDKDIKKILMLLPETAAYYFCKPGIPRGLDAGELQTQAAQAGLKGKTYSSVKKAVKAAQAAAKKNDLVFIGGSTFVVAEAV
jgi:dihydrofolate synthase / folylpolyglutamate synthase